MTNDRDDGSMDEFDERLRARLREEFPAAEFPRDRIERDIRRRIGDRSSRAPRTRWPGGWVRSVLPAAAALVVFIAGAEYGRRTATAASPVPGVVSTDTRPAAAGAAASVESSVPIAIQESGSRYVASLARLGGETGEMTPEDRRVAREVALTVFHAALTELLDESAGDEGLREVLRAIADQRARIVAESDLTSF